tara:strand:+ start:9 stop:158 length:150 start_codon:yes stop_codon:yes gene_type:complete
MCGKVADNLIKLEVLERSERDVIMHNFEEMHHNVMLILDELAENQKNKL